MENGAKTGYVHSLESFGSVDGPGVRYVIFLSGCAMRCQFCHNPDTWNMTAGKSYTADALLKQAVKYRTYWGNKGGITVSGGEPLLQIDFLTELFAKAKVHGIHTCLDTSGIMFPGFPEDGEATSDITLEKIDRLLDVTDLVMLDIKHIRDEDHRKLTGHSNKNILAFARYLDQKKKPVWIRHVVVPGITFEKAELTELGHFLKTLSNMEKLEVLPYHALGKVKYDNLGMDYVLKDTPQLTKEEAKKAEQMIRDAMS